MKKNHLNLLLIFFLNVILFSCGKDPVNRYEVPEKDPRLNQIGVSRNFELNSYNVRKNNIHELLPGEIDMYSFIFEKTVFEYSDTGKKIIGDFNELFLHIDLEYSNFRFPGRGITDLGEGSCKKFKNKNKELLIKNPKKWARMQQTKEDYLSVKINHCYLVHFDNNMAAYDALFHVRDNSYRLPKAKNFALDSGWTDWHSMADVRSGPSRDILKEYPDFAEREEKVFIDEAELLTLERNFQYWRDKGDYWPSHFVQEKRK